MRVFGITRGLLFDSAHYETRAGSKALQKAEALCLHSGDEELRPFLPWLGFTSEPVRYDPFTRCSGAAG